MPFLKIDDAAKHGTTRRPGFGLRATSTWTGVVTLFISRASSPSTRRVMAIREHPDIGTILICDFDQGFRAPEMVKRRPVVVISPRIRQRSELCAVVALSTSMPAPEMPYHCPITIDPPLPPPWDNPICWVKGDIVCSVGFHRLDFPRYGKEMTGKRVYRSDPISPEQLLAVRCCVLSALGLAQLTRHMTRRT